MSHFGLFLLLVFSVVVRGDGEDVIRRKLNIPPDAKSVLIFGQASHLDWDWLNWFPTNVNNNPPSVIDYWSEDVQPTDSIFATATEYLQDSNYGYSVCEMGFLRKFATDQPDLWAKMKSGNLHIVGGGITSPDNLLPHGEAFIRDYLVGLSWVKSEGITWGRKIWLPDDFGHDSQLPVMLQALGVKAASFSRTPGSCYQGRNPVGSGVTSAHQILLDSQNGGLDFMWQANDGSSTYIYYQPNHYCCGDGLYTSNSEPNTPLLQSMCMSVPTTNISERIAAHIGVRSPLKKTPYMFVATGCDFRVPLPNLVKTLSDWNAVEYPKTGVYAVSASLDEYADLVLSYLQTNGNDLHTRNFHGDKPTTSFRPTPYWMGFYSSRVALKQLHFETVRSLLGAETFLSVARKTGVPTQVSNDKLKNTWDLMAPSTHHDFITGTATDYVYEGEQLPLLQTVLSQGTQARDQVLTDLVTAMTSNQESAPMAPVWVAFNQLGFSRSGFAEISFANNFTVKEENSLKNLLAQKFSKNLQISRDGTLISVFSAPSLGYQAQTPAELVEMGELTVRETANDFTIDNTYLSATISKSANWAVTSIIDKSTGKVVVNSANNLEFREDNGNIYRYGYEEGCGFNNISPQITALDGQIVENGPVRIVVAASIKAVIGGAPFVYKFEYTLIANEPFLRVAVFGAAANFSSVITKIEFAEKISDFEHGTPYHWDYKSPAPYGLQDDFQVTIEAAQDFVVANGASGNILGAVYHNSTPAWGVSQDQNTLYGMLLRNSPSNCAGKGAEGHDNSAHYVSYAVRVPSGLTSAASGQPLKESRAFQVPIRAFYISAPNFSSLPSVFSLAQVAGPTSGIITAAKPGEYQDEATVFRVYYPGNVQGTKVTLQLSSAFSPSRNTANVATALEEPSNQAITWSGNSVSYTPMGALSTVIIS